METKIILKQGILIGCLLFSQAAMATGFTGHDTAAPAGRNTFHCSGVNGSGQPDQARDERCDAGGKGVSQPTLRGHYS